MKRNRQIWQMNHPSIKVSILDSMVHSLELPIFLLTIDTAQRLVLKWLNLREMNLYDKEATILK